MKAPCKLAAVSSNSRRSKCLIATSVLFGKYEHSSTSVFANRSNSELEVGVAKFFTSLWARKERETKKTKGQEHFMDAQNRSPSSLHPATFTTNNAQHIV
jgi:menaquinone-dependent protoporphyrinogen IX oxidase